MAELIQSATFVKSSVEWAKCPEPTHPEFAFIGRSNVGKSSLINMLVNKKGLAKTSATPGKTQQINHFIINEAKNPWFLVDLPGYGYAKSAKSNRVKWEAFIRNYLGKRENLVCTFILIDYRIPPQKIDLEFLEWLGQNGIPFTIIFTKCEKLSKNQAEMKFGVFKEKLLETWENLPPYFFSSATERIGRQEILETIAQWAKQYKEENPL
jgi:GTP-binding protein